MIAVPDEIQAALEGGSPLIISISGGKDSDAMTYELVKYHRANDCPGEVRLIHADLGRAEWKQTPDYVRSFADWTELPLTIVKHTKFDLLDGIRNRMKERPGVPPWPSAKYRQCTSDWKREPISRWLRQEYTDPSTPVICAIGLRAEESLARAKKPIIEKRQGCCTYGRTMLNWLPIHQYKLADVWSAIGNNHRHPAYGKGNHRLSCALCILADLNDLVNGAESDPELFQAYCDIEIESGFSFRQNLWLGTIHCDLLRPDQVDFYQDK